MSSGGGQLNGLMADAMVFALGGSSKVDPRSRSAITSLEQIIQFEASEASGGKALNLGDLDPYLKAYLAVRQRPYLLPVGVTVAVLTLLAIGYFIGRK